MSDLLKETLLPLHDVAGLVPPGRGRRTHVSTVHRWVQRGVGGVRLEAIRVGGRWLSSREALGRFVAALTARTTVPQDEAATRRATPELVEEELDRLGIGR
jgi:hypothetical protein